jgi:secreted trypsin-like serine protease
LAIWNSPHYFILHNKLNNTTTTTSIMTRYSHAALSLLLSVSAVFATSVRRRNAPQLWTANESIRVHQNDESPEIETRIVGGEQASEGEFPWFASSSGDLLCGASLIHKQFLL